MPQGQEAVARQLLEGMIIKYEAEHRSSRSSRTCYGAVAGALARAAPAAAAKKEKAATRK